MKETAINPLSPQQTYLDQIGSQLQQHRLAKNWSLTLVARKTKIRQTLLENIEAGRLEQLPELVYLQGLIRRYGECLGLNVETLLQDFPKLDAQHHWQLPRWSQVVSQFQLRPRHLYAVYLLMIVATVQSLGSVLRNQNPALIPQLDPALQENVPAVSPQTTAQETALSPQLSSTMTIENEDVMKEGESVVVDIRTQEMAWMRVEIDGETAFEGTLEKGTQKQWIADESVRVRSGNAGAVYITINNQPPHRLGEPGAVEEFTYQAKAAESRPKTQASS